VRNKGPVESPPKSGNLPTVAFALLLRLTPPVSIALGENEPTSFIVTDRPVMVCRRKTQILQNEPKLFSTGQISKSFSRNKITRKSANGPSQMTVQNEPSLGSKQAQKCRPSARLSPDAAAVSAADTSKTSVLTSPRLSDLIRPNQTIFFRRTSGRDGFCFAFSVRRRHLSQTRFGGPQPG